jgi:hypothetical protein
MKVPYDWIRARLTEPSTYRGIGWLLATLGITVSQPIITIIAVGIVGIIDIVKKDEKNR